jgi:serine/threonine protein phosphatase PrpC
MALAVEVAGKTDVGCLRSNNEDSFAYDLATGAFVVCDGMGGRAAGEVASSIAVESVLEYFRAAPARFGADGGGGGAGSSDPSVALASAIEFANRRICQTAARNPAQAGMGSTVVAALWTGDKVSIAHVGDSRIYLVRDGEIRQLTSDHSLVMEEVRVGLMSLEEAQRSEMQNIILRALGAKDTVQSDVAEIQVAPQDILLLTTDGLVRHVEDRRILHVIEQAPNLKHACEALIQCANDAGGSDNITCLLVKIVEEGNQAA